MIRDVMVGWTAAREPSGHRIVSQYTTLPGPVEGDATVGIVDHARQVGDAMEEALFKRP
jgi:hypothetical protein